MRAFNPNRFIVAQKRRQLKRGELAKLSGISEVTISRLSKNNREPDESTVAALASALAYPIDFFYMPEFEELTRDEVSFRSLARMPASERDAAISAGSLGILLYDWIDERFNLPKVDVPDLRIAPPKEAATLVRQHWGLGERPIKNILKLLESKGVRTLSLCENNRNVDAFSFWRGDHAYIFLNTFKTSEHSVFDSAHELGHLVLHQHESMSSSKQAEAEANEFAAELLMPTKDILARAPRKVSADAIIKAKSRWNVSAMAFARRLFTLDRISEWQYRTICIELSRRGFRSSEPNGIERQTSSVLKKVFEQLWSEKITKSEIAQELNIPLDELECLIFDLVLKNGNQIKRSQIGNNPLRAV